MLPWGSDLQAWTIATSGCSAGIVAVRVGHLAQAACGDQIRAHPRARDDERHPGRGGPQAAEQHPLGLLEIVDLAGLDRGGEAGRGAVGAQADVRRAHCSKRACRQQPLDLERSGKRYELEVAAPRRGQRPHRRHRLARQHSPADRDGVSVLHELERVIERDDHAGSGTWK
jgi:hypothetical protein